MYFLSIIPKIVLFYNILSTNKKIRTQDKSIMSSYLIILGKDFLIIFLNKLGSYL